jgi:SIR2-like domain
MATGQASPGASLPPDRKDHFGNVARAFEQGRVTPVLGAGVNLSSRAEHNDGDFGWLHKFPPSAGELAAYLIDRFTLPDDETRELLRLTQRICDTKGGEGPLFDELHKVFAHRFTPTVVHEFLARLPGTFQRRNVSVNLPLIVTTNYDDLMETALTAKGLDFDLLVYIANGPREGQFCHRPPGGELQAIDLGDSDDGSPGGGIDPTKRTVVLKLHGFVDIADRDDDSYVISEDHYIEYLTRIELDNKLPLSVLRFLRNSHLLFLGYSLRDWNLRAMLHKLRAERLSDRDWWAVQLRPDQAEVDSWKRRGVEILDMPLDVYTEELAPFLRMEPED